MAKASGLHHISAARNAAWLGLRFFVVTVIGLISSRVVLSSLGVTDYGVYAVVGSVISALGFLNTTMAGATSRFFAFEMGCGGNVKRLFAAAVAAHSIIAAVVVAVAETAGLWFVGTRLDLPAESAGAARWIYQFAVLSAAVAIVQTPFTALVMAHERMKLFARVEVAQSVLKLGAALAIALFGGYRLVAYGGMMASVAVVAAVVYLVCCRRYFPADCGWVRPDRAALRPLLSFSAFDLYGNLCVSGRTQGLEWLINIFFGVVYNAGAAVANIVNNAVVGIASAVTAAFRPRVIKLYAAGDYAAMSEQVALAALASGSAMAFVGVPCFIEADTVLALWLGEVPPAATGFVRLLLVQSFVAVAITVVSMAVHATGKVKALSVINGSVYLSTVGVAWWSFRLGAQVYWAYGCSAAFTLLAAVTTVAIAARLISSVRWGCLSARVLTMWALAVCCAMPVWMLRHVASPGLPRLIVVTASYAVAYGLSAWVVLLDRSQRHIFVKKLSRHEPSRGGKRYYIRKKRS